MMSKIALITGASQGLGYEFAKLFANDKYDLFLTARDESRLREIADELQKEYGVNVEVLSLDLSLPDSAKTLYDSVVAKFKKVDVLVNNAGFGIHGESVETDEAKTVSMINLNVSVLVELCKLFGKDMKKNRDGKIMNVASTASFNPLPYMSEYAASKAFVLSYSLALREELAEYGVQVVTLCPGPTRTQFFERMNEKKSNSTTLRMMESDVVAKIGYEALMQNKPYVVAGRTNKLLSNISRLFSPSTSARLAKKFIKK